MSKFQLTEVSPGKWLCKVEGFAPLPLVAAPDREAALAQIRTRIGDTARLGAALGAPAAAGPPALSAADIKRISLNAEIALARLQRAPAPEASAPRAVDPRIVKAFGLQTPTAPSNPCIQTFGAAAPTPEPVQLSRSTASTAIPSGGPAIQARSSGAHSPAMQAKLDAMVGEAVLPRGVRNESHRQVFGVRS